MSHSGRGGGIGGGGGGKTSISRYSDPQETATSAAAAAVVGGGGNASSSSSAELRLYQAFIFSVPIFFTFVLLSLFYLFCLRRRRLDWPSLTMPASSSSSFRSSSSSRAETGGLKKEVREMLPVIVFKESFSVKDTQCSVCLGDYQAEERLQQIPACGHTFHRDCIDSWLSTHTTCPLCRQSLLVSAKASIEAPDTQLASHDDVSSNIPVGGELSPENGSRPCEDSGQDNDSCNTGERILTRRSEEEERGVHNIDDDTEMMRSSSER